MPKDKSIESILVIGSGPIIIGQAAEFDYAGTQACIALKEEGYRVILLNNNPATVMTDHVFVDEVYFEPMTVEGVEKILKLERPDGIIGTVGGQAGLNLIFKLSEQGILEKYNVKILGTSVQSIKQGEDREAFRSLMHELKEPVPESEIVTQVKEATAFADQIGFPLIIRPAYTLGGTGGGIAYNMEELTQLVTGGLSESPINQCLIERSIAGFKEIEYEMMRDADGTCIAVCNMENIDPVGIHTGDSIVVAPSQTLTDKEYQMLRTAAVKIISALGIVGGCNIQFALDPESRNYYLIEVNPRVSRSSALASKATGYPIARMAAKLAAGYSLAELKNPVTGNTFASYEPALDYVVVKLPKWPFEQFPQIDRTLGTQMKATGEAMAMDRSFERAFLKAIRSLNIKTLDLKMPTLSNYTVDQLYELSAKQTDQRIFALLELMRRNEDIQNLHVKTKIDLFFLAKFKNLIDLEIRLEDLDIRKVTASDLKLIKEKGFSDQFLAETWSVKEQEIRSLRKKHGILPVYKMVDTCAAEFESASNYFYSSYFGHNEAPELNGKRKVLVIGSGPISIGQGIEFDYCSVHGVFALKDENVETIMINNNPETVSTDFAISDRLYFEPLTIEDILNVIDNEGIEEVIVQLGGQTALNLAKDLENAGVKLLGTSSETIDLFEDRDQFYQLLDQLEIPRVQGEMAADKQELLKVIDQLGYPVLIRPSYVIGGLDMAVIHNSEQLDSFLIKGGIQYPILVDQYLEAKEAELDIASDGKHVLIPAIIEHIEKTGVHSGDSFCILPAQSFSSEVKKKMADYAKKIVQAINYRGLMNIQFIVKEEQVYLLEINPRSSRTMPIVSKIAGVELVGKATKLLLGKYCLSKDELILDSDDPIICVKHPVFSNFALKGLDAKTGPQMISTGEGISIGSTLEEALLKSFHSIGGKTFNGTIAFTENSELVELASSLNSPGINFVAYENMEEPNNVAALFCPGDTVRDKEAREWAVKNRKIILTQTETLEALIKSVPIKDWTVKPLSAWHKITSEGVVAK
jgi:carbamoyl-phosphate synthase large subunit